MAFCWIYGVKRLCDDVYFMLGYRPNIIWRMCWKFVTPIVMIVIFIYSLISLKPVTYNGYVYKDSHYGKPLYSNEWVWPNLTWSMISFSIAIGWCITALGISQLPIWATVSFLKQAKGQTFLQRLLTIFRPLPNWGPTNPVLLRKYKEFIATID